MSKQTKKSTCTRYTKAFNDLKNRNEKALVSFLVIGDPDYDTSLEAVKTLVNSGTDILELGLPFSDPIADGPTIQAADVRSIDEGMDTDKAFEFIKKIRCFTDIPIGLLVYSNLIYQYGILEFYKKAKEVGVDSILPADVPMEEAAPYIDAANNSGIDTVFLISPLSDDKRVAMIAEETSGFLYVITRVGITGAKSSLDKDTLKLVSKIRKNTTLPICAGFGVSTPSQVKDICNAGADGVIVGSAIVKIIEQNLNNKKEMIRQIETFVKSLKKATRQ